MDETDPMDALTELLSGFHISIRMRKATEEEAYQRPRLAGDPLPQPLPGRRPVWEPPVLGYSWFEGLIGAQKEVNVREGSKDIAFRTDIMDNLVEKHLLGKYFQEWVASQGFRMSYLDENTPQGSRNAHDNFWKDLGSKVCHDLKEADRETDAIEARHVKKNFNTKETEDG